ncbi:MobF family relaxase [Fibrella forsythiae]|uniref:Relaxase domain-containing protein n=1 Tax=Fibrella forsythiae TaxID=2817061 RepID=A0ABS3JKQ1_9BACT|nr:MobF family relaxase [Fibrella forsythiae]MBO0950588.1 relaxase domain-containing protein [Fibrella forsythiae]
MIRLIQASSAAHAKAYFSDALSKADYYLNDQELQGQMRGKLADRLGLAGPVFKDTFFALCENLNPGTGEALTPRTKDNRVTGWDCNFHVPKSVSILHGLSNDDHILDAFRESVRQTMDDIEQDVKTRVRKDKAQDERVTGELLYSEFVHQTARPVDGQLPDPHLHAHCFIFNATWDDTEQQIKSARLRDIYLDLPYYHARFHKRLSDKLIEQGYQVRRTTQSFEVEGVPQKVIDLFSKRTDEIGRVAKEKGITDPNQLDELGARTRAKKQKGHSMAELKTEWRRQISELKQDDQEAGKRILRYAPTKEPSILTPEQCVDHALQHDFERASVKQNRRLLVTAYRQALGHKNVTLDGITEQLTNDARLIHVQDSGRTMCTTREVLSEEQRMVRLAQQGQGKLKPLYTQAPDLTLDGQQAAAVNHVLTTPHRVSIIRGVAGSGKTTLMGEAINWMEKAGKHVTVVAPTAEAARGVLRNEGFAAANTVANLLHDKARQQMLAGQILWVDEAGLLGTKDMSALLELATQQNARLILGGDTRQHASVIRGDALRILNTVGGIQTAEVSKIYRQRHAPYRAAVEDLSKGDVSSAFIKLDSMGSIQSIDPLKPNEALVKDYVEARRKGKSALVVSPTHKQGDEVTDSIRQKLKASGMLGKREIKADRLSSLNLTEAQKGDWRNLQVGQIIQFNQNRPGIGRGSVWTVASSTDKGVLIQNDEQQTIPLPLTNSRDYDVYHKSEISLAKRDAVRITRNGFDQDKNRLNNGQLLDVVSVSKQGDVVLRNTISKATYRLDKSYGHIAHAYCITSHAAQGKTVDEVFISQPASTFAATDAKQLYVSVSRGRDRARIYTDDKEQLLMQASRLGERQSALELVKRKNLTMETIKHQLHNKPAQTVEPKSKPVDKLTPNRPKDRDHEPRL